MTDVTLREQSTRDMYDVRLRRQFARDMDDVRLIKHVTEEEFLWDKRYDLGYICAWAKLNDWKTSRLSKSVSRLNEIYMQRFAKVMAK